MIGEWLPVLWASHLKKNVLKMAETNKPAFPQTPDGVTDWEKVFEDPDQGLISVIRTAQTSENLRACMMIVIRQLFTRDDDELQVAQLTRQLDDLLAHRMPPSPCCAKSRPSGRKWPRPIWPIRKEKNAERTGAARPVRHRRKTPSTFFSKIPNTSLA